MSKTNFFSRISRIAGILALCGPLAAQAAYPDKPITLVVPYSAGGAVDIVGRIIGQKLSQQLKVPVIVENKAGFSGNIGAQYVARANPDGYTLLMAALTSYSLNHKLLGSKLMGYDFPKDFRAVGVVGKLPVVLVVNHAVPAGTLPQLVAYLKKNPGKDSFGSSGAGSIEHVAGELFRLRAGVNILHVPYRGSAPAMLDLMSGQIQIMFATTPTTLANLPTGKIKAIGIAGDTRVPLLPKVPTLAEQGLKGLDVTSLYGVLVPKGTPDAELRRLNAGLEHVMNDPQVRGKLQQQGVVPVLTDTQQAATMLGDEVAKWGRLIDETHIVIKQ
ncbi:tripartite tricarboxylate transporter substrate binding protein [Candidimonas humi]|uniref:Bug family tripartite tricarboxylate transporter substrate binding protein n=1 Tax=Candidimonas humi TaxID=683355 RepID=A0ABV8NYV4_9BURK|nr:tripartite tricarboxylate transporter substrate binding protein [Candidimonas humi]MBV6306395.1 tripartite tricarboxylate transporter substrate binding protein [Candidimonas humi]